MFCVKIVTADTSIVEFNPTYMLPVIQSMA